MGIINLFAYILDYLLEYLLPIAIHKQNIMLLLMFLNLPKLCETQSF